jgi:hypothetical protein
MICKVCKENNAEICFNCFITEKMEGTSVERLKFELLNIESLINELKNEMEIIKIKLDKRIK